MEEDVTALTLYVDGWSNARRGLLAGETLMMEVARLSCLANCSTCAGRIWTVSSRLQGKSMPWSFISTKGGLFLVVPAPESKAEVGNYLSELLGLRVATA